MTLVPLGFAMWLAHFVFHLFTGSHTPIPVIQRVAQDLHLSLFGKPDWSIASWAVPQLLDFEILFLDFGLLVSLYAGWRVAQRYSNAKSVPCSFSLHGRCFTFSFSSSRSGSFFNPWICAER